MGGKRNKESVLRELQKPRPELKKLIKDSGVSRTEVAHRMSMSRSTLDGKLNGYQSFYPSQIEELERVVAEMADTSESGVAE